MINHPATQLTLGSSTTSSRDPNRRSSYLDADVPDIDNVDVARLLVLVQTQRIPEPLGQDLVAVIGVHEGAVGHDGIPRDHDEVALEEVPSERDVDGWRCGKGGGFKQYDRLSRAVANDDVYTYERTLANDTISSFFASSYTPEKCFN